MSTMPGHAVLDTILRNALDTTQAASGWIVVREGGRLVVASSAGDTGASAGDEVAAASSAGFCLATGEPAARQPRGADQSANGAGGYDGVPPSLLTVPCLDDAVGTVGALELAAKATGPFSIDDIELVSILAAVAGTAIATSGDAESDAVAGPNELALELARLAATDRRRYVLVARTLSVLLGA